MNRNIQPGLQGEQKDELKSSEDHFEVFFGKNKLGLFLMQVREELKNANL